MARGDLVIKEIAFSILRLANRVIGQRVFPPSGRRKTWKIIDESGGVRYSPTKLGGQKKDNGEESKDVSSVRDELKKEYDLLVSKSS